MARMIYSFRLGSCSRQLFSSRYSIHQQHSTRHFTKNVSLYSKDRNVAIINSFRSASSQSGSSQSGGSSHRRPFYKLLFKFAAANSLPLLLVIGITCMLYKKEIRRYYYYYYYSMHNTKPQPVVVVLHLQGVIMPDAGESSLGGCKYLNLDSLSKYIDAAFGQPNITLEVCLVINSPGGSPVQSELIANRIMHLSKKKKIDVVSFVEDYAASGGYWLACIGKEIYTAENSIAGSIGVIASSFGFDRVIKDYGIDRRTHIMGKNKDIMDPFSPETPEHKEIMRRNLHRMYVNFQHFVKQQRGSRLKADDDVLFTGEFWVGEDAVKLGLVDQVKTLNDYLHEKYAGQVRIVTIKPKGRGFFESLFNSALFGTSISDIQDNLFHESINSDN